MPRMSKAMQEGIDMILGCCEGQVFFSRDFPQAIIIGNDSTWIARVSQDGSTEEAYLSTRPMEEFVGMGENEHAIHEDDLPELQGFTTGFTC
jgi:hypothetical protein